MHHAHDDSHDRKSLGFESEVPVGKEETQQGNEIDQCHCGDDKFAAHCTCKKMRGRKRQIRNTIEPGRAPCPACADPRDQTLALCTRCSKGKRQINRDGTRLEAYAMDRCKWRRRKRVVFAECSRCWKQTRPARNQFLWRKHEKQ